MATCRTTTTLGFRIEYSPNLSGVHGGGYIYISESKNSFQETGFKCGNNSTVTVLHSAFEYCKNIEVIEICQH